MMKRGGRLEQIAKSAARLGAHVDSFLRDLTEKEPAPEVPAAGGMAPLPVVGAGSLSAVQERLVWRNDHGKWCTCFHCVVLRSVP